MSIQTQPAVSPAPKEGQTDQDQNHRVVVERILDAPAALVWKVWTTPEHIERWWGHDDFRSEDCAVEARAGGEFRLNLHGPNGVVYPCLGVIRELVPHRRLVLEGPSQSDTPCGAGIPPRAVVTVTFEAIGEKTKLTIDTRFETASARSAAADAGYDVGWGNAVDRLAAELATV